MSESAIRTKIGTAREILEAYEPKRDYLKNPYHKTGKFTTIDINYDWTSPEMCVCAYVVKIILVSTVLQYEIMTDGDNQDCEHKSLGKVLITLVKNILE